MKKKASMVLDPASGKNVTVKGWGDVECCEELKCDLFEIPRLGETVVTVSWLNVWCIKRIYCVDILYLDMQICTLHLKIDTLCHDMCFNT